MVWYAGGVARVARTYGTARGVRVSTGVDQHQRVRRQRHLESVISELEQLCRLGLLGGERRRRQQKRAE